MASQYHPSVKKQPTLFFKPIHCSSLPDKLMIPRKFVKKYGDAFSDTLFLKLPNGEEWEVNLEKRNGDVWLEKGWREFAEHHSLFQGRLLVFGYDDSTSSHRLNVLIMDLMTSGEIEYPSNYGEEGKEACNDQVVLQLPETEILEEGCPSAGTREKNPPLPCLIQQYKKKRIPKGGHHNVGTFNSQEADLHHTSRKCQGVSQEDLFDSKCLKSEIGPESRALERAKAFKSHYPSFLFVAKPSHINGSGKVSIPCKFGRMFLGSKKNGESIILRILNGRVWVAKLIIRKSKTQTKFEVSWGGWNAFVKDNDLKVDDVCVFELIKGSTREIKLRVSIFRNTDPSNTPLSQERRQDGIACQERQKKKRVKVKTETEEYQPPTKKPKCTTATSSRYAAATAAADSFNSENPFFKLTIGVSHGPAVPGGFVRKYLEQGKHVVELQVGGGSWRVKLIIRSSGSLGYGNGFFSEGWAAFARENHLQVGDACFFELVNRDNPNLMKVSIFKHN